MSSTMNEHGSSANYLPTTSDDLSHTTNNPSTTIEDISGTASIPSTIADIFPVTTSSLSTTSDNLSSPSESVSLASDNLSFDPNEYSTTLQELSPAMTKSATIVHDLSEVMENIVNHLPTNNILNAKLISKHTNSLITTSPKIVHRLLFPTEHAPAAAFVPNALGTSNFFITDEDNWSIMMPNNLCSLQLAPSERGEIELYYHLHRERLVETTLPPLTTAQKQTMLFPLKASTRVNVTNWAPLNPQWIWNDLWMTCSIHVKSCRLQDLVELVEKLNIMLYLINEKEAGEVEKAEDWMSKLTEFVEEKSVDPEPQLAEQEKAMFVKGAKLEVGFGHWWNVLRNEYRDI